MNPAQRMILSPGLPHGREWIMRSVIFVPFFEKCITMIDAMQPFLLQCQPSQSSKLY
jgi:hypothetical protein